MLKVAYKNVLFTINELSEMSGIAPATLRDRLRRGYSVDQAMKVVCVDDGVEQFCEASHWEDWIGMPINDLYEIYWKWVVSNEYRPLPINTFSKQLKQIYPMIKTVPITRNNKSYRVVRVRS